MKAKMIVALTIVASIATLESLVRAQPLSVPIVKEESNITIDNLEGVGTRTAQDDFMKFFEGGNITMTTSNSQQTKLPIDGLDFNRSTLLPSASLFLQPALSTNGNDGLEVQVDVGN